MAVSLTEGKGTGHPTGTASIFLCQLFLQGKTMPNRRQKLSFILLMGEVGGDLNRLGVGCPGDERFGHIGLLINRGVCVIITIVHSQD